MSSVKNSTQLLIDLWDNRSKWLRPDSPLGDRGAWRTNLIVDLSDVDDLENNFRDSAAVIIRTIKESGLLNDDQHTPWNQEDLWWIVEELDVAASLQEVNDQLDALYDFGDLYRVIIRVKGT